jgi:hypothetical protein
MLPTFLVVGAPKAGTSSLHRYAGEHPDVFVPERKEPCYFGMDDGDVPRFQGPGDDVEVNAKTVSTRAAYEALFAAARPDQARGDFSTQHLAMPGTAARVAAAVPDARIVAVLREPASRAASHWSMKVGLGHEDRSFADALAAEDERMAAGFAPCWGYRRAGRYAEQLASWFEHFPREQVLVLRYDDLERDPQAFLEGVFRFVGVDPTVRIDTTRRYNTPKPVQKNWLQRAIRHRTMVRAARAVVPRTARHRVLGAIDAPSIARPEPETLARLRTSYQPELERLASVVDLDLTPWRS